MDIVVEMFKGNKRIKPRKFFEYTLQGKGDVTNIYKTIGSAAYKLSSQNRFAPVFTNKEKLYALIELDNIPQVDNAVIQPIGEVELPIEDNESIYGKMIEYFINVQLWRNRRDRYKVKYNKTILCNKILTRDNTEVELKSNKGFNVKRKFVIYPTVNSLGEVLLRCYMSNEFISDKNIYNLMQEGKDVTNIRVNYEWGNLGGYGEIVEVLEKTIDEPLTLGQSLIEYFENNKQEYRVKNFTEEDKMAKVVKVKLNAKKAYDYIPQSLTPVITREYMAREDKAFSEKIDQYIKMDMEYRMAVLCDFIGDIGEIRDVNCLKFRIASCSDLAGLGYEAGMLGKPILRGENGPIKNKMQIFKNGFYKYPNRKVKFGVLYPEGHEKEVKVVIRGIYEFCNDGKYKNKENNYIKENLLNIQCTVPQCIWQSYKLGDITEYKRIAKVVKEKEDLDFIIAVIPDRDEEDIDTPYNPFKKVWAEYNIPSQMISLKTVKVLNDKSDKNTGLYYLHNIALGILGKIGGIPWVLKSVPGNVDCFIGLDVGTREKGIHFPACSVMFDKYGTLINYYKPNIPQSGEIIQEEILQEIFDQVLLSYEDIKGTFPTNIVIHRDGFAREDIKWYENYFGNKNIKFNIVEVKKNGSTKFGEVMNRKCFNPRPGIFIKNDNEAFLVTTEITPTIENNKESKLGSPNPLKIQKTYGELDMKIILTQIYYLSQIHVGSPKSMRLPITTGYADKICKFIEFIPQGKVDNRLFFL